MEGFQSAVLQLSGEEIAAGKIRVRDLVTLQRAANAAVRALHGNRKNSTIAQPHRRLVSSTTLSQAPHIYARRGSTILLPTVPVPKPTAATKVESRPRRNVFGPAGLFCSVAEDMQKWKTMTEKINAILNGGRTPRLESEMIAASSPVPTMLPRTEMRKTGLARPGYIKANSRVKLYNRSIKVNKEEDEGLSSDLL